jgi:hypothetical protein
MGKRSTKFYRKNEAEVMKRIGLKPTKNSGAGWIEKSDGQSELCICELKSTDKKSISVKQEYLNTLEYNAAVSHKIPVFAFQFLNKDEVWVAIKEDEFREYMKYKEQQKQKKSEKIVKENDFGIDSSDEMIYNTIKGQRYGKTYAARQRYEEQNKKEREQREEEYKNKRKEYYKQWQRKN